MCRIIFKNIFVSHDKFENKKVTLYLWFEISRNWKCIFHCKSLSNWWFYNFKLKTKSWPCNSDFQKKCKNPFCIIFSFINIFLTLYLLFVLYHFRPISVYLYVINKGFFYAPMNLASPIEAELFQIESVTKRVTE